MIVSPIELGRELVKSLGQVNSQIQSVEQQAREMGISVHDLRDTTGNWVVVPLLAAKAQLLHSIAIINQKEK